MKNTGKPLARKLQRTPRAADKDTRRGPLSPRVFRPHSQRNGAGSSQHDD
jgi:hypothetical protein